MLSNNYCCFNVVVAHEIIYAGGSFYIIKIENSTKLKVLRIEDEEVEVIGDYVKK